MRFDIVIPTVGRPSLSMLLEALADAGPPWPETIVLADDRRAPSTPLRLPAPCPAARTFVVRTGGRGPAAARNAGWRTSGAPWVVFLDDDVVIGRGWAADLAADLAGAEPDVAAVQGRITVPTPSPPSDWERNVAGLASARWITADMAVRRRDLARVGGFDERFRRAYREDADLALRLMANGRRLAVGGRTTMHPVRPAPWWISVALQRGNADDALMSRLHGRAWRQRVGAGTGAFGSHAVTVAAAVGAAGAMALRRWRTAGVLGGAWLAGTARFAFSRIAPGPRTPAEVASMAVTSVFIPPAAVAHRLGGHVRHRRQRV
jgi:hypothetical protein